MAELPPAVRAQPDLVSGLLASAALHPEAPALLAKDASGAYAQRTSFASFVDQARRAAGGLAARGFGEGDRAAVWADNRPAWNLMEAAVSMNRGATLGIYANEPPEDIAYKLEDASVRVVLVDRPERAAAIAALRGRLPGIRLLLSDGADPGAHGAFPFASLMDGPGAPVEERIRRIRPDDLVRLMYTSGTTGRPKGVQVTHRNLLANVNGYLACTRLDPGFLVASYLPSAHIFQALLDACALLLGCTLAYTHKTTLREDLPKLRPHFLPGVPKAFKALLQAAPTREAAGLDRAACLFSGGAKLDAETVRAYRDRFSLTLDDGYGISEASGGVSIGGPLGRREGKCGRPIPGLELKIVDESGAPLPPGSVGQILIRGDMVFPGYLNRPGDTARVLRDGWFHTGDRGSLDADGFLEVFGRMGHRVKFSNGEYYDLEAIADGFLRQSRLVGQAVVAGEQRDACVALLTLSEDLLAARAFARARGIPYSDPRELVYHPAVVAAVREEFEAIRKASASRHPYERIDRALYLRPFSADNREATPTQKTRIRHVLDKYAKEIDTLYAGVDDFRVLELP